MKKSSVLCIILLSLFIGTSVNAACTGIPDPPELIGVTGTTQDTTPDFTWKTSECATWYRVWINRSDQDVHIKWYESENICSGGECAITLTDELFGGEHTWWVQPWSSDGYGRWSSGADFYVESERAPLEKPVVDSLSGETGSQVEFSFSRDDNASWYQVWVANETGEKVFNKWYPVSQLESNHEKFSITPDYSFASGNHTVWVQSWWSEYGYSQWSDATIFTVQNHYNAMESFSPVILDNNQSLRWVYGVNGGRAVSTSMDGINLNMTFSDIVLEIDSNGANRTADFSGSISGDASGSVDVNVTSLLQKDNTTTKVLTQGMTMDMFISAQGQSLNILFSLDTSFNPASEWFLDRTDLDTLPIGYEYDEQGVINADVNGYVTIAGYGSEFFGPESVSSAESWEIVDKLDSLTVNGTTYQNVVKVLRKTIEPDMNAYSGTRDVQITYWVAKGIGMIKGTGQFNVLNTPLEIELKETNLQ